MFHITQEFQHRLRDSEHEVFEYMNAFSGEIAHSFQQLLTGVSDLREVKKYARTWENYILCINKSLYICIYLKIHLLKIT